MKRFALTLAALALPTAATAQLACIPQPQAAALVTFALPTLVSSLGRRCGEVLPPGAYLVANAQALADRYQPDSAAAWPTARRAIGQIFQQFLGQPMSPDMNPDLLRSLAEPALGGFLAKQVDRADCAVANEAVTDARALSGTDIGRLAVLAVTVADRKDKGLAGVLRVCRPGSAHE